MRKSIGSKLLQTLVVGLVGLFVELAIATPQADAQLLGSQRLIVVPSGGAAMPIGDIADYVGNGPSFGLDLLFQLQERIALGLALGHDSHDAALRDGRVTPNTYYNGPPYRAFRYGIAAEFAVLPPRPGGFTAAIVGGGGMVTYFSEKMFNPAMPGLDFQDLDEERLLQFKGTYPSFNGGLRLGYVADQTTTLFAEGNVFTSQVDQEHTVVFIVPDATLTAPKSVGAIGLRFGIRKAL